MENMEPDTAIFCNQIKFPVVEVGHQTSHKTEDPQYVLPAKCAGGNDG